MTYDMRPKNLDYSQTRSSCLDLGHQIPLWGAPRIHGELLKLGIVVSQAAMSKYVVGVVGDRGQSGVVEPVRGHMTDAEVVGTGFRGSFRR